MAALLILIVLLPGPEFKAARLVEVVESQARCIELAPAAANALRDERQRTVLWRCHVLQGASIGTGFQMTEEF